MNPEQINLTPNSTAIELPEEIKANIENAKKMAEEARKMAELKGQSRKV